MPFEPPSLGPGSSISTPVPSPDKPRLRFLHNGARQRNAVSANIALAQCVPVGKLQPKALSLRRQDDGGAVNLIASSYSWLRPGVSLSGNLEIALSRNPHKPRLLLGLVSANMLSVQCAGVPELQPDAFRQPFVSFEAHERSMVAQMLLSSLHSPRFPRVHPGGLRIKLEIWDRKGNRSCNGALRGTRGIRRETGFPLFFALCAFRLTTLFSRLSGFLPWSFMPHVHSGFPGSFLRRNTCHLVSLPNVSRQQPHSLR